MIDLHCHILPGIDDGAATLDVTGAMVAIAEADGIHTIVATPHVDHHHDVDALEIAGRVAQVQQELSARGSTTSILPGAEVAISRLADLDQVELAAVSLGGSSAVLLEAPLDPRESFDTVRGAIVDLMLAGRQVVLAHPERSPVFLRSVERLEELVRLGVATSITAGALTGTWGKRSREMAFELLRRGLAHNLASDAHDARVRRPELSPAVTVVRDELLGDDAFRTQLVEATPQALLASDALPRFEPLEPRRPRRSSRWSLRPRG